MRYLELYKVENYRSKRRNNKYIRYVNLPSGTISGYIKHIYRQKRNSLS